jgi:hypothetical protein
MAAPSLSILVLTEDSGKHGLEVAQALVKKMLRVIDSGCDTRPACMSFEPGNDDARKVVSANGWESRKRHHERVTLVRSIATKICEANGFVFFHFDGDQAWSRRSSATRPGRFDRLIMDKVRILLLQGDQRRAPMPAGEVEERLGRLRALVPFYSIEAWLYQNTKVAIRLCHEHHGGRDVDTFKRWQGQPHEIDELEKPKDVVCLADKHNRELATTAYPIQAACAAGTSLANVVHSLRQCGPLLTALAATRRSLPD